MNKQTGRNLREAKEHAQRELLTAIDNINAQFKEEWGVGLKSVDVEFMEYSCINETHKQHHLTAVRVELDI